jgi:CheY-like chemotaxis protein
MPNAPLALALISDLMFMVKIQDVAKAVGLPVKFLKTPSELQAAVANGPTIILFDLNLEGADVLDLIKALKANESTKDIHLVGFISHVQIEARAAAEAAGCDMVLARSVFSQQLPAILEKYSEAKAGRLA